ncbi:MAG: pantoate--beta-alanine ligase [Bacteroidota bacterium]
MEEFSTITETRNYLSKILANGKSIGFVPTMGALHAGHLSLISRSKLENDVTVCSIFVNPTQFNNKADLQNYPRTMARDTAVLREAGCDVLFAPSAIEMYPEGESAGLVLDFGKLDKVMEGKFRPGHFSGVATIVEKLFAIVKPARAYFGKKDFQQLAIIRYMVKTLEIPVEIVACEIIREPDGLAMSSRNMRLTIAERNIAPKIYQVLTKLKEKSGKIPVPEAREWAAKKIREIPEFHLDYLEIGDMESLQPVTNWRHKARAMAFIAVFLGDVRLIDNIELFL